MTFKGFRKDAPVMVEAAAESVSRDTSATAISSPTVATNPGAA